MSAPKPELDWSDDSIMEPIDAPRCDADCEEHAPLPVIPDAASQAIVAAVVSAQTAQHNLQSTVGLVLATLGLSLETHDVQIVEGRAVIVQR